MVPSRCIRSDRPGGSQGFFLQAPSHKMGELYWGAPRRSTTNPATAWMVPGESANVGEWIEIELPAASSTRSG
jgi:hypothetical protein